MRLKQLIDKIQELVDLHGDTWLAMFTATIVARVIMAAFGFPPVTMAESAAYASAVTAFAATNIGGPRT